MNKELEDIIYKVARQTRGLDCDDDAEYAIIEKCLQAVYDLGVKETRGRYNKLLGFDYE